MKRLIDPTPDNITSIARLPAKKRSEAIVVLADYVKLLKEIRYDTVKATAPALFKMQRLQMRLKRFGVFPRAYTRAQVKAYIANGRTLTQPAAPAKDAQ